MSRVNRKLCFFFILCVAILLGLSWTAPAYATNESTGEATEELALEFAERFADTMAGDFDLTTGAAYAFCNTEGVPIGWMVDYLRDGMPHGYVVFDGTCRELVAEYSFSEGSSCPISSNLSVTKTSDPSTTKTLKTSPLTYISFDVADGEHASNSGISGYIEPSFEAEILAWPDERSSSVMEWDDVFFDDEMAKFEVYETRFINSPPFFVPQSESEMRLGRFACTVNSLTCASLYFGISSYSDILADYNAIWSATNTKIERVENGVEYGSTQPEWVGKGFQQFAASKGKNIRYEYVPSNVSFSFFENCINSGGIGNLDCYINVMQGDGSIKRSGHAISVQGYQKLSGISDVQVNRAVFMPNVLIVHDGWNKYPRYINLEGVEWDGTNGVSFLWW